jgi:hypothetical protein
LLNQLGCCEGGNVSFDSKETAVANNTKDSAELYDLSLFQDVLSSWAGLAVCPPYESFRFTQRNVGGGLSLPPAQNSEAAAESPSSPEEAGEDFGLDGPGLELGGDDADLPPAFGLAPSGGFDDFGEDFGDDFGDDFAGASPAEAAESAPEEGRAVPLQADSSLSRSEPFGGALSAFPSEGGSHQYGLDFGQGEGVDFVSLLVVDGSNWAGPEHWKFRSNSGTPPLTTNRALD